MLSFLKHYSGIGVFGSFLIICLNAGCDSGHSEPVSQPVQQKKIEKKPTAGYVLLEDVKYTNVKRMLKIQLPHRMTEERLIEISRLIRKETPAEYKYLSIWYYLPDIPMKNGIWANAQFYDESLNPVKPEVIEILCLTIPCYKELTEAPLPKADKIIGIWMLEKHHMSKRKIIYQLNGEYFCNDLGCGFTGGGNIYPQLAYENETKFVEKDTDSDEYYLINQDGDLELRSEESGCFAIGKRLVIQ